MLVLGPDSSLGPMIAATVIPLAAAGGDPQRSGRLRVRAGADGRRDHDPGRGVKLGFIADLLSKPTQIGYMNGLALTILVSQLPKLFGFSVDADGVFAEAAAFVDGLVGRASVGAAVAVGLAAWR